MKGKKWLLALFTLTIISSTVLSAHGKGDVEEKDVRNLNSWTETFDLEGKKKGKYNILITAKDKGGNTYVEGPYNILVDPDSDLCVPGITNPYPNMRVVGNLNIVGTCIDDDGVDHVELILDGNEDSPIRAEGSEFWSYYLDTVDLEEGPHTIKVVGYDINGLKGKTTELTWQLDRRQPITTINDKTMGLLVSGNVHFSGLVEDGNGIRDLFYSIDNGENFREVKIKNNQKARNATFDITVNTKDFPDGPAVLWLKATDNAGSTGIYSFLYFIDNTKPEVKIISPTPDKEVNGKFSIAGYAKDKIGITSLTWTYGAEKGEIELIPGNPYWCLSFDALNSKEKSQKFSIKAVDVANNVVEITQNIKINAESDKPIVTISSPVTAQSYFNDTELFVRGLAVDDDGVKSVRMILDNESEVSMETRGPFQFELPKANELTTGKHKVTVIATDVNGIDGNPVVVDFLTQGDAPKFGDATVAVGKESTEWTNAMEIHPESGSVLKLDITSTTGIKNVHTKYSWKKGETQENDIVLKNTMSYNLTLPVTNATPKGLVKLTVTATDIYDRTSEYTSWLYITNTSVIKSDEPKVVFEDSRIDSEGRIVNDINYPVTGYVIGANIKKAELSEKTKFATLETDGNLIKLIATEEVGTSEPITVKVTTEKNDVIESRPLIFVNDTEIPTLEIEKHTEKGEYTYTGMHNLRLNDVKIKGKAACKTGLMRVQYRVMSVYPTIDPKTGLITAAKSKEISDWETLELSETGEFEMIVGASGSLTDQTVSLGVGSHLIEFVAESNAGNKLARVVAFDNIPERFEDAKGIIPDRKPAIIEWFDGLDVYARAIVQDASEEYGSFWHFPRSEMIEGGNAISWTAEGFDDGMKPVAAVTGKFTAMKAPTLSTNFVYLNDREYMSGMTLEVPQGADGGKLVAYIDTGAAVSGATYEIYGDEIAGGDVKQTGAAKLIKPDPKGELPTRWIAEIPLKNLSSRVTKIKLNVKAGGMEQSIEGSIQVVRYVDELGKDDDEKIYTRASSGVEYRENANLYLLGPGSEFYYYANLVMPITAELVSATEGLEIRQNGRLITMKANVDTEYKNVVLRVTDGLGDIHESAPFNFLMDSGAPDVVIETPKSQEWLGNIVHLSGTAADTIGVQTVEYSLDNGETWSEFSISGADGTKLGVTYTKDLEISHIPDGTVTIDIRATDTSGNSRTNRLVAYKDVTPPEVTVVEPLADDIVNGENLIVFEVKDNAILEKVEYVSPDGQTREKLELGSNLVSMLIGTKEHPIEDAMSFVFTDEAGNKNEMIAWKFLIDNESDLPVSEIHVPEEDQVITRDFTISGVIYDDDGPSTIFYKIDDGVYKQIPDMGTSFSIDVPLTDLTDNEHTVTVYAVDINGVKGLETTRKFRISLEEPKGAVVTPTIDNSVREVITIKGVASDKNGIAKVMVSLDNGNSYNDAVGTEEWEYVVDTRAIPGGTQVVFLKIFDNYGIQGLYSSLINIDNQAPTLSLELPEDDSTTTGNLFFSGFSYDNVEITNMYVTIRNLENKGEARRREFKIDTVIGDTMDITDMEDGFYNIELTAEDKAGNKTNVSRNIHLEKNKEPALVDLLYPLNGEHKTGKFNLYGQASSEMIIEGLHLYVDGHLVKDTRLSKTGFFKFELGPEDDITEGTHEYYVEATLDNNVRVKSRVQTLTYSPFGPWVKIDNFDYGDFATKRPFLRGEAGYSIPEDDLLMAKTKEATKEFKAEVAAKAVSKVEISFDNGKSFTELSETGKWAYRIENEDMSEGYHFMFIRATMKNGETAIERTIVQIDNTHPNVTLISPTQGSSYNQQLEFSGLSVDDVGLETVTLALRKGDKSSYELPSFIQGLYLDVNFWGASLFDLGAGLTFFDENVKLQAHWGQFTQEQRDAVASLLGKKPTTSRYGGSSIFGMKLLANISTIPFSYFFGHDWDWLYASVAIGAKFSYFSDQKQILSAVLGQLEFPRVHFNNVNMFSTLSMYTEGAVWFIPSDVASANIKRWVPTFSVGFRVNVF